MWKLFSFASVWRVPSSVLVSALNRYRGGHGFVSRTSLSFQFAIARVASVTAITGGRFTTYWTPNYMALCRNLS